MEGDVAVLVTAAGHRPERIVLPTGGTLRVTLAPLPLRPKSCALDVPSGVTVEAIAADLDRSSGALVRGSAVICARDGEASRASIVHCDGSVRIEEPSAARVGVTIGKDADLLLDGGKVSGDRITVPAGFHRVTSKGPERWVPMFKPIEIKR